VDNQAVFSQTGVWRCGAIVTGKKGDIMPVMIPSTLLTMVYTLGATLDPAPARSYMWVMIFQIIFILACVGVSVKWTKKTHQD
jgi:hypothetical protein